MFDNYLITTNASKTHGGQTQTIRFLKGFITAVLAVTDKQ